MSGSAELPGRTGTDVRPETLLEHRQWLRAIARSLVGDENSVDDVEQRTWMTVLRNRRPVGSVRGWLRRVVRSAAVDEHRSVSRRRTREELASRPESLPATDHLVEQAEAQRAVAAAVTNLPEPYRATVLLRYFEGLAPSEIAARTLVPVETVKTRLKRALAILREALDRDFGDRRAWAVVLLPLAGVRWPVAAGAAAGGIAMGMQTKVVAAAAAVALAVAGLVWTTASGPDRAGESPERAAVETPATGTRTARTAVRSPAPRFAIVGRVRSRHDGRAVAGAVVSAPEVRGDPPRTPVETAADGTFRLDDAVPGTLSIAAPRYVAAAVEVAVPTDDRLEADVGDVWLSAAAALVVEVLGPRDAPVAGAEVRLVRSRPHAKIATTHSYLFDMADPDSQRTTLGARRTDASGIARFEAVEPASHEVAAGARGFAASGPEWVVVAAGSEVTRATIRLGAAHRLAGRVVTAAGEPAADRLVDAGNAAWDPLGTVRTDADGRFVIEDVPAGDVSLRVGRSRGTNPTLAIVRVPDVSDVELRLPPMGAVVGTVTLADGSPVDGAEVGVESNWGWNHDADALTVTDAEGHYRIDDVPAGTLGRFVVRRAGLHHVGPRLEIGVLTDRRSGKDTGIDPRIPSGGELRLDATMARGARLRGRVTGPEGGVGGAWVYLHFRETKAGQEWETAVCDAEGRYSFDFLPPGPGAAVPLHPGYVHPDAPAELGTALAAGKVAPTLRFELPEGGDVTLDFRVVAGTRVAGRVVGPAGEPVAGAVVRCDAATYSSPPPNAAVTDARGAWVLGRVAGPGKTKVRAEAPGLVQTEVPEVALVPAGNAEGIEIRMAAAPRVTGRILDSEGGPVAGARVSLAPARWDGGDARRSVGWSDASGAYSVVASRVEGPFKLTVTADGLDDVQIDVAVTPAGATADVVFARGNVVTGRVTSGGRPVAGASVAPRDGAKRLAWYYGELLNVGDDPEVVRTSTDADGRFRLTLPPGEHVLFVRAPGFVDEAARLTAPTDREVEVAMRPAATLAGTLRGEDGKPFAGAVLLLEPGPDVASEMFSSPFLDPSVLHQSDKLLLRRTDALGAFAFPGIPEGSYGLVVLLPGSSPRAAPREVRFGPLRPSGGPYDLTMAAPLSQALAGRVVDGGGAAPSDAKVLIAVVAERGGGRTEGAPARRPKSAEAAADGTFRIEDLTATSYTLHVTLLTRPSPIRKQDGTIVIGYAKSLRRAFHGLRPPREDLVLEMTEGARTTGRLVDDAGAPLARWTVEAAAADGDPSVLTGSATTREDGTFEIPDLEDADYRLTLRRPESPGRRAVPSRAVRGGADLGDVVATLEARIRGTVVDAAGAAVPRAVVEWYPVPQGIVQSVSCDETGAFEITGLEPGGRYHVGANRADGESWWFGRSSSALPVFVAGAADIRLVRE